MRQPFILLTSFILLLACNHTDQTKVLRHLPSQQQRDPKTTKTERQILIEELKRLKGVFAANDKEKIADLFNFPIANETVGIYIDDSILNAELAKNGNQVTRAMFLHSYRDVSESLQMEQVKQLFKKLNLDHLLRKDTLEHAALIQTEPCYSFYGVKVENKRVTLTVGTNSNKDYPNQSVSEDELAENDSSICEHVLWWVFRLDGKQLHLEAISGAG